MKLKRAFTTDDSKGYTPIIQLDTARDEPCVEHTHWLGETLSGDFLESYLWNGKPNRVSIWYFVSSALSILEDFFVQVQIPTEDVTPTFLSVVHCDFSALLGNQLSSIQVPNSDWDYGVSVSASVWVSGCFTIPSASFCQNFKSGLSTAFFCDPVTYW